MPGAMKRRIYEVLRYAHEVRCSIANTERILKALDDFNENMTEVWESSRPGNIIRNSDWTYHNGSGCDLLARAGSPLATYCASIYVDAKIAAHPELLPGEQSVLENIIFGHEFTSQASCVSFEARTQTVACLTARGACSAPLPGIRRRDVRKRAQTAPTSVEEKDEQTYWARIDELLAEQESLIIVVTEAAGLAGENTKQICQTFSLLQTDRPPLGNGVLSMVGVIIALDFIFSVLQPSKVLAMHVSIQET